MEKLKKDKKAWVLSYWQIIIERYPKMGERYYGRDFCHRIQGTVREPKFLYEG